MENHLLKIDTIVIPQKLPFLESICWQTENVYKFTLEEMLSCYERNWRYRNVLESIESEELEFIKKLATTCNSWLQVEL